MTTEKLSELYAKWELAKDMDAFVALLQEETKAGYVGISVGGLGTLTLDIRMRDKIINVLSEQSIVYHNEIREFGNGEATQS